MDIISIFFLYSTCIFSKNEDIPITGMSTKCRRHVYNVDVDILIWGIIQNNTYNGYTYLSSSIHPVIGILSTNKHTQRRYVDKCTFKDLFHQKNIDLNKEMLDRSMLKFSETKCWNLTFLQPVDVFVDKRTPFWHFKNLVKIFVYWERSLVICTSFLKCQNGVCLSTKTSTGCKNVRF